MRREVIVAYLGCGCVAWYAAREYLPQTRTVTAREEKGS